MAHVRKHSLPDFESSHLEVCRNCLPNSLYFLCMEEEGGKWSVMQKTAHIGREDNEAVKAIISVCKVLPPLRLSDPFAGVTTGLFWS